VYAYLIAAIIGGFMMGIQVQVVIRGILSSMAELQMPD